MGRLHNTAIVISCAWRPHCVPAMKYWHFVPPYTCSHLLTLTCQKRNTWTREFAGLLNSPLGISITWKYIQPQAQSSSYASSRHWVTAWNISVGLHLNIFLDLYVWREEETICSLRWKLTGPGKSLLFHGPIQTFKCKSMQTLYLSHVPANGPTLTFILQGLPQAHVNLPQVHASTTSPSHICIDRWITTPNLTYRLWFVSEFRSVPLHQ